MTVTRREQSIVEPVLNWYQRHRRDLPWRRPGTTPWAVLVSEVMLQQTPVRRVLPTYDVWMARWPAPADLAADEPAEAIRAWGRLGYPRRALRLHAAAVRIAERHGGSVPAEYDDLRALPGVGDYTAAAVASFAFRQRHAVLDANVRRVLARTMRGAGGPPRGGPSLAERRLAESLAPSDSAMAARWAVAAMELGALVCTARTPLCTTCPIEAACAWRTAGRPAAPPRRRQPYEGTDRQARGRLLGALRDAHEPVPATDLAVLWTDEAQRVRALHGLVADGLAERLADGSYRLPR